ncbi:MAG: hypothetical protein KKA19_04855, partial [Candidatus Margulisbacteria bacterium]|nr:hypothetical protein [Candidatus Margulisiibacteriota bacterium]
LAYKWYWFDYNIDPLLVSFDLKFTELYPIRKYIGFEWWTFDLLAFRFGFCDRIAGNGLMQIDNTIGIGLKIMNIGVDYTYYPNYGEEIDSKHFLSVQTSF